nr:organic cation transporter-like protein [Penaeus vannamei]
MSDQLENIMVQLGTGRWNILHFITVGFGAAIPTPHGLASAFFSPKIDFACTPSAAAALPPGPNDTSPTCSYFTEDPVTGGFEEEQCTEWDFDNSTFRSTVTSEYNLVCGREYLRAIYQSMYMFGVFMGSPINGFLADRYGRKPLVVGGSLMFTAIAICSVWLTNFSSLLAARFLVGLGHSTLLKTAYILALEVSAPRVRSAVGVAILMPWSINTVIFSGVAYLIRDWRMLQLVMSLLGLLHIPGLWLIDESPRWLAVRGQHQRALSILKKAARWNKVTLPPDDELIAILKSGKDEVAASRASLHKAMSTRIKEALMNLAILFRTPRLRKITLICYLDYLVVAMVYFGLSLSGASLSGNVFVYMALMGLVEMPPCVIVTYQVARLGRRVTTAKLHHQRGGGPRPALHSRRPEVADGDPRDAGEDEHLRSLQRDQPLRLRALPDGGEDARHQHLLHDVSYGRHGLALHHGSAGLSLPVVSPGGIRSSGSPGGVGSDHSAGDPGAGSVGHRGAPRVQGDRHEDQVGRGVVTRLL